MLLLSLMVSIITPSLAQTVCDVVNYTLHSDTDCLAALSVVFDGANSSTNATAVMMVCENSTTCNQNITAYLDYCPVRNRHNTRTAIHALT